MDDDNLKEIKRKRAQQQSDAEKQERAAKSQEQAGSIVNAVTGEAERSRTTTQPVSIQNPDLSKTADIDKVVESINRMNITTFMSAPGYHDMATNMKALADEVLVLQKRFESEGLTSITDVFGGLVSKIDEVSKTLTGTKIKVDDGFTKNIQALQKAIDGIEFNPVVNVASPETPSVSVPPVDLKPLLDAFGKVEKAISNQKVPITNVDLGAVTDGLIRVQESIEALRFPVSNYILPFKDSSGKAVQVQLDPSGNVPTAGGAGGTQYVSGVTTTPATGTVAMGRYNSTAPTLTDGQLKELQLSKKGELSTYSPDSAMTGTISAADAVVAAPGGAGATVTGASTAGSLVALQTQGGDSSWIMQFSGTFGGTTIYFEGSLDSTTGTDGTWININGRQTGIVNTVLAGSTTTAGVYRGNTSGWTWIRARAVSGSGITVAVRQEISSGTGAIFLNASIPAGTNMIGTIGVNDGTNTANVVAGDTGFNGVATAAATKSFTFTTSGSGAQILGPYDVRGYSNVTIHVTGNTTVGLAVTGQFSSTTGGTYNNSSTFSTTAPGQPTSLTNNVATGTFSISPTIDSFLQLNVSALTSGTWSGTITLSNKVVPYGQVASVQAGTWTVGSNSATGSAVPANAFYTGVRNSAGNLTGMAAVAAIVDADPGSGTVAVGLSTYNGSTFDRTRSATAASNTTGTGLLGVGNLNFDGTNWQTQRIGLGDATSTNALDVSLRNYNGTNTDRVRNNTSVVVVAAGTTSTQSAVAVTTYNARSLILAINITAGAGTLTVTINGVTTSGYIYPILTSTALAGIADNTMRVFPGATAATNTVANDALPRSLQITYTVVGSVTYGSDAVLSV